MIRYQPLVALLLLLLHHCTIALGQSPAPAPAPPGPTNVIKILKKAAQFKTLIRLLKTTQLDSNLNSQLGNTNNALTIFAPSDSAFSSLKKGTISKLTNQQKVELVQFHIVPAYILPTMFDTVSNPLKTHAGSGGRFMLNVTSNGNSVNIRTGLTNTTISNTVYTDSHLAIYKVDKVLLPLDIFTPMPQAPAPAMMKEKSKHTESSDDEDDGDDSGDSKHTSGAVSLVVHGYFRAVFMFGLATFYVAIMD